MDPGLPRDALLDPLTAALRRGPAVRLAVLFGSAAVGNLRASSDLDVAVLFRDEVSLAEELDLQLALERATQRAVDLVRLDDAATLVRWQVALHGIPLIADPHEWSRFRARSASEYADFRPALEDAAARFRRRLVEGAR